MPAMLETESYDVVIVGAGPTGLISAYGLQTSGISTIIIERDVKASLPMYGRACTLYPRTLEMLDQYGLLETMNQVGFICRDSVTFDKEGKRVTTRGWHSMFQHMGSTFLDYVLNLRLKYSEDIFMEAYLNRGGKILQGWEVTDIKQNDESLNEYPVMATIQNVADKSTRMIQGRYILGTDGGHSLVRKVAEISSERMPIIGSPLKWIRIDGVVKTNMPTSELGAGSIESPTHGNILWVNLDHRRTRIGYNLPPDKTEEYANHITEAQAVEEAQKAMLPWNITFESVDWFTNYSIRQSLAEMYMKGRIILAGDACHTHSSAAAQGMNTGVHDAVNLAWKLAGVIKGWYNTDVLASYELERRPVAKTLIELDQAFSKLISGTIPEKYQGWSDDPNVVNGMVWEQSVQFNIGLGISYESNILNQRPSTGHVTEGHRAPDALIYRPGSHVPIRLHQATPHTGGFWLVVFAGEPILTLPKITAFRTFLDSSDVMRTMQRKGIIRYITIISGEKPLAETALQGPSFGQVFYDRDNSAFSRYGLAVGEGGIAVLRPDGIFGFGAELTEGRDVEEYFGRFIKTDAVE